MRPDGSHTLPRDYYILHTSELYQYRSMGKHESAAGFLIGHYVGGY